MLLTGSFRQMSAPFAIGLLALVSSSAVAAPGDHIRFGDVVITPSVEVGSTFHSNLYLADGSDRSPEVAAPAIQVQPRLKLSLPKKDFQLDWEFGYHLKTFIDFKPGDPYNVTNLDRFNEVDSTLEIVALPRSFLGMKLGDTFSVTNYPAELGTSEYSANVVVTSNDVKGGFVVRPGTALDVDLLGQLGIDNYNIPGALQEDSTEFTFNNRASFGPMLNANWRFLPKTTLISDNSVVWYKWQDNLIPAIGPEVENASYGNYIGKPDGVAWRSQWGVKGQFTQKVSAQAEIGFGQAYYDEATVLDQAGSLSGNSAELDTSLDGETFSRDLTSFSEGFLVDAQLAYTPIRNHSVTLGYRKDFQDAVFTNYLAYNYGFLRYNGLYGTKLGVSAEVGVRVDGYHGEVYRKDLNVNAKADLGYKFTDFLNARLGGGWIQRSCADKGCEGVFYSTQYDDFYGEFGVTVLY